MKLDFNKPFFSIRGDKQPSTLGELFADVISTEQHKEATKLYNWAVKFAQNESVDLDKADFKLLEDLVNNHGRIVVLLKAQLLQVFEDARDEERDRLKKKVEEQKVKQPAE